MGTRFHGYRGKNRYFESFADAGVRRIWETAVDLGLIVELHVGPSFGREVRDALNAMPETVVLIDHLCEPHTGNAVEFADILDLTRFENVYMKLSGLAHFTKDAPYYESAKPFTRLVAEAFGPDRLVWGDGSPKIVDVHLPHWSESDRAKVKGGNLARLLWSDD